MKRISPEIHKSIESLEKASSKASILRCKLHELRVTNSCSYRKVMISSVETVIENGKNKQYTSGLKFL